MKNWFFIVSFILTPIICSAQIFRPRFETFNVNKGLSQSYVNNIYQDSKGFIWFGTADGLNRYDGNEIKIVKLKGKTSFNSNFVRGKICEDKKGNLWYANETGLYQYNRAKDLIELRFDYSGEKLTNQYFEASFIDKNQTIWMVNNGLGILSYNIINGSSKFYSNALHDKIFSTKTNAQGVTNNKYLWYSRTTGEGFFRFNIETEKSEQLFNGKIYTALFLFRDTIYIATTNSIDIYDSALNNVGSIKLGNLNSSALITAILVDSLNRIWLGTHNSGLWMFDRNTKKLMVFTRNNGNPNSISSNLIKGLFIDRTKNLWIGTDGGGVSRIDLKPAIFNLFPRRESDYPQLQDYFTKCFYEDEQKKIWFGTASDGFSSFDPRTGQLKIFNQELVDESNIPISRVGAIFKDKSGLLWIGSNKGISIFDPNSEKTHPVKLEGLPDYDYMSENLINRIIQLSDNRLMISGRMGIALVSKNKNGIYTGQKINDSCAHNQITDLLELGQGDIWYSSYVSGLYHLKLVKDGLKLLNIYFKGVDLRSVHHDEEDNNIFWLSSGMGLIKFEINTGEYLVYNESQGLADNHLYGIVEDNEHHLWVSTNGGLSMFDKIKERFVNYNNKDGLQSNEFNSGAFLKGKSGTIYFGGIKGFNWFIPSSSFLDEKIPSVSISKISINDSIYLQDSLFDATQKLILPYHKNFLSFQFSVLDYTSPQGNKIQYQLSNWDKEWITTYDKSVSYSNLPPGDYTLRVQAIGRGGTMGKEEIISIIISPPFMENLVVLFSGVFIALWCHHLDYPFHHTQKTQGSA